MRSILIVCAVRMVLLAVVDLSVAAAVGKKICCLVTWGWKVTLPNKPPSRPARRRCVHAVRLAYVFDCGVPAGTPSCLVLFRAAR